jgi:transcriptional regulator with XRE-family HTH domain
VRELRLAGGLTQDDLAERCGLFRTYLSRIETGRANPTLTMIHALAASLGVPVIGLFGAPATPALAKHPRASLARGRVSR